MRREISKTERPFTLVCRECHSGASVPDEEQAFAAGWSDLDYAPGLPTANHVGLCPDCRERFENWPGDGVLYDTGLA
jgi:hypothetical protein